MGDYTIRDVPDDLHRLWKTAASLFNISMREYVFRALRNQVKQDITMSKDQKSKNGDE